MEEVEYEYESALTVMGTWPDVFNSLLPRLVADEVLRQPYECVSREVQMDEE